MSSDETVIYTTPSIILGQHEWVIDVFEHSFYGKCTRRRWRRVGDPRWRLDEDWPTYDSNNGATGGMPKRLAGHFWRHHAAIQKALGETPAQSELF